MTIPPTPAPPNSRAARAERYLRVLDTMVDVGTELLEDLRPAKDAPNPGSPDRNHAFDRTARAIRLTMLLADKLEQIVAAPTSHAPQTAARERVLRAVEDIIHRAERSPATKQALTAELHERLDSPDLVEHLDATLELRPAAEIVTDFTRDLGLLNNRGERSWPRRTPEDIRRLFARAAGAPLPPQLAPHPDPETDSDEEDDDDRSLLDTILRSGHRPRDG